MNTTIDRVDRSTIKNPVRRMLHTAHEAERLLADIRALVPNTTARAASPSFFWTLRLLPPPRRTAIHALYAFCHEIREAAGYKGSWALKLKLLADWRCQIALLHAGRPQHLITQALHDAVIRFDLCCADFLAIINGVQMSSCAEMRAPSVAQLDLYCEQTAVAVLRLALRILGLASSDGERLAAALGRGIQLTAILRDLVRDGARSRLYLPRELLQAHGIFATIPSYVLAQPALPFVCNALAERAAMHFGDAELAMVTRPRFTRLATTAVLSSYRSLLEALLARGWQRLDQPVSIAVWRQPALRIGQDLMLRP